jgi:hypothetical protein
MITAVAQLLPSANLGADPAYSLSEAAAIIGCTRRTINRHVLAGHISANRGAYGHWYVDEAGITQLRTMIRPQPRQVDVCASCIRAAELLYRWDSGTTQEMAPVIGIVEGNVRKHLGHLARDGHAMRQLDGTWVLTVKGREWIDEWIKTTAIPEADEFLEASFRKGVDAPG